MLLKRHFHHSHESGWRAAMPVTASPGCFLPRGAHRGNGGSWGGKKRRSSFRSESRCPGEGTPGGEGGCKAQGGDAGAKEPGQGNKRTHAGYTGWVTVCSWPRCLWPFPCAALLGVHCDTGISFLDISIVSSLHHTLLTRAEESTGSKGRSTAAKKCISQGGQG